MPDRIVSGSVIQRTFVSGDLPVAIFAASVPLDEIEPRAKIETEAEMRRIIAQVLAVPANSLLDEIEYQNLVQRMMVRSRGRGELFYFRSSTSEMRARTRIRRRLGRSQIRMFAEHSVALMVAGDTRFQYWY